MLKPVTHYEWQAFYSSNEEGFWSFPFWRVGTICDTFAMKNVNNCKYCYESMKTFLSKKVFIVNLHQIQ